MSEIFVDTIKNKAGSTSLDSDKLPDMYSGSARAHVNFSSARAIQKSLNVSSITDSATGRAVVNFTNDFNDSAYGTTLGFMNPQNAEAAVMENNSVTKNASSVGVVTLSAGAYYDANNTTSYHLGDLA